MYLNLRDEIIFGLRKSFTRTKIVCIKNSIFYHHPEKTSNEELSRVRTSEFY